MNKTRRRLQKARRRAEETEAWLRGFNRRFTEHCRDLDASLAAADKLLAGNTDHASDEDRVTHYECMMRDGAWVTEERS